jgi:hypothetical protein
VIVLFMTYSDRMNSTNIKAILLCTYEVLLALPFTSDVRSLDYGIQLKIHTPSNLYCTQPAI